MGANLSLIGRINKDIRIKGAILGDDGFLPRM